MGWLTWRTSSSDEPLTPVGRTFFHHGSGQVIHLAVGMKHRIDAQAVKEAIMNKDSVLVNHPRFCSLMVRDARGVEHWRRTHIDIDRHVILVNEPVGSGDDDDDDEAAVNEYLAELSLLKEMDYGKPLWEIHVLSAHNCIVMRIHHSLGDGVSLVSMILTMFRHASGRSRFHPDYNLLVDMSKPEQYAIVIFVVQCSDNVGTRVWNTLAFMPWFILRLWVPDQKSPITGGDGVELWPRKLATARFLLDDMRLVKRVLPGATINDVLTGVISLGLCRYLDKKQPGSGRRGLTGLVTVSLRNQPGLHDLSTLNITDEPRLRWGNQLGLMQMSFPTYNDRGDHNNQNNPLGHVIAAKAVMDRMKSSYLMVLSYWLTYVTMTCFGPFWGKAVAYFAKRFLCNTTFDISNIVGPPQENLSYLGNPIRYIKVSVSSSPHALTMQMITYGGRANLQVLVAKDIIPDPEFLAECFESALRDVKAAVEEALLISRKQE